VKSFLTGFLVPLLVLWGWGLQQDPQQPWIRAEPGRLAALLVLLPLACAYAGARLGVMLRPRRLFDRRMSEGAVRRGLLGAGAGTLAVVCIGGLLILLDRWVPDWALITGASTACAAVATLTISRVRPGACFFCGYDLSAPPAPGQPGFGLCPECGADCISASGHRRDIQPARRAAAA
jgi:hypothetical protein